MNRLSFGIKTAPSEFYRILNQILTSDLEGVTIYFDDIIGSTYTECKHWLIACLERLRNITYILIRSNADFSSTKFLI